jgi:hypothetical protein
VPTRTPAARKGRFYAGVSRDWNAYANIKRRHFTTDWREVPSVNVCTSYNSQLCSHE